MSSQQRAGQEAGMGRTLLYQPILLLATTLTEEREFWLVFLC